MPCDETLQNERAAKRLGVTKMTILCWIKAGKIKAYKIGREHRVHEEEIRRLLSGGQEDDAVLYARISSRDQREDLETQIKNT